MTNTAFSCYNKLTNYRQKAALQSAAAICGIDSYCRYKFYYDATGICGFNYDGTDYYFQKNIFGDILRIYSDSGALYAEYSYDALGKCTIKSNTDNIANINPFRYRGYYYDRETGWYYLNSRYYDPEVGRFLSADTVEYLAPETINGLNLYAYCGNNPIMYTDSEGTSWWTDFWNSIAGKIVGTILVVGAVVVVSVLTAGVGAAVTGALGGGIAATIVGGAVGGAVSGMIIGAGASIVSQGVNDGYGNIDWGQVGIAVISGAVLGAVTGALTSGVRILNAASKWYKGTFKSGLQSMRYHYSKHGSGFGNILNYTKSAINFANRNSSLLKYTFNYKFGNASWNFSYLYGNGGMFTSSGKIITFW